MHVELVASVLQLVSATGEGAAAHEVGSKDGYVGVLERLIISKAEESICIQHRMAQQQLKRHRDREASGLPAALHLYGSCDRWTALPGWSGFVA